MKNNRKLIIVLSIIGGILVLLSTIYILLVSPVDSNNNEFIIVKINKGTRTPGIAKILKKKNLIKSELIFNIESKLGGKSLKADIYRFKKSMSMREIIKELTDGSNYNPDIVRITFKEGNSIKKYAEQIEKVTDNSYDDVINTVKDKSYLQELINKYWFLTDDILNDNLYYNLEGYLFPDTYEFKNKKVEVKKILETMLNQTDKKLSKYKDDIKNAHKSIHDIITMASILELEGTNTESRKMIAGVFNNRLSRNMNMGSDVTSYYAVQADMNRDLSIDEFNKKNLYNTRASDMGGKLPVGPICNPGLDAIEAALYPSENDYLFFVADKNGKVYYTKNDAEHTAKVKELKEAGMWIW